MVMNKAEIQSLVDYITDLDRRLSDDEFDHISMQAELSRLRQVIKLLMDATFESQDKHEKVKLAALEMYARGCKDMFEESLAMRN